MKKRAKRVLEEYITYACIQTPVGESVSGRNHSGSERNGEAHVEVVHFAKPDTVRAFTHWQASFTGAIMLE